VFLCGHGRRSCQRRPFLFSYFFVLPPICPEVFLSGGGLRIVSFFDEVLVQGRFWVGCRFFLFGSLIFFFL